MTSPKINLLRLSMIWTLPVRIPPDTAVLPLADDRAYDQVFVDARDPNSRLQRFEPPWPPASGALFWTFYLSRQPRTVDGAIARSNLVPVRERLPPIATALGGVRVVVEGFYAHTGIAVVISVTIDETLETSEAIDRAIGLRRGRVLETPAGRMRAEDVAIGALSTLHENVTRAALPPGTLAPAAFTIATVIQLEGFDETDAVTQGDERHRVIDALAHLEPEWRSIALPELSRSRLDIKQSPPSHVLYARDTRRTVWYPSYARASSERRTRLACYHRNLTFASMQAELLLGYSTSLSLLTEGPSARESDDLVRAQRMISRLHGRRSYRTSSVRAQIEARINEVNESRQRLGMPRL